MVLTAYADKAPDKYKPKFLLGSAYKRAKKFDQAVANFRTAIKISRNHKPSYDGLLDIFEETRQNYESRILLNDMITIFGPRGEFATKLCRLYTIDGYLNQAVASCKAAITRDPKYPDNHIYLAQSYYDKRNKRSAERIFRQAGRQFKKSEFVQYAVGNFYLNEKNSPTAVRYLRNAVRLNGKSMRAALTLALALFEGKDFKNALIYFRRSCKLDKTKDTVTELKNSASKLLQLGLTSMYEKYSSASGTCFL